MNNSVFVSSGETGTLTKSRSLTTTKEKNPMAFERRGAAAWSIHPGGGLKEEFMKPLKLSSYAVAKAIHVPVQGLHDIVLEKRGVTPAMALRLARYFETTEEFWLNLQAGYELTLQHKRLKKSLKAIRPARRSVA